jgi:hypothetical protein
VSTFKMVAEHIHGHVMTRGRQYRHAKTALEILLLLTKKTAIPLVDAAWVNELLRSGAMGNMDDGTFTAFLGLNARRKEEESTGGIASSETLNPLFIKISQNVQTHSEVEGGWRDDAVYGGLLAMRDIPQLGSCLPNGDFLKTLSKVMRKSKESKPLRVRKAAYDVILVAQDRWLRSPELRQKLEELDFPRQLYSVVTETGRSDHLRSFLMMMGILSEDNHWHSYLRGSMDIWLPLRHEGPNHVLRILTRVSEIPFPEYDGSNPPLDKFLTKLVEDEWAGVPGRLAMDLTADRLEPLVEVTMQFGELLFTESGRGVVLAAVDQVIPALERRRDDGYAGPGEDIHGVVDGLRRVLRSPMRSASR